MADQEPVATAAGQQLAAQAGGELPEGLRSKQPPVTRTVTGPGPQRVKTGVCHSGFDGGYLCLICSTRSVRGRKAINVNLMIAWLPCRHEPQVLNCMPPIPSLVALVSEGARDFRECKREGECPSPRR